MGFGVWKLCNRQPPPVGFSARTEPCGSIFHAVHGLVAFRAVFEHLRVSQVYLKWSSEFIHPGYSESGMNGFHLACFDLFFDMFGFRVVRIRNLSVVPTLQWGGNKNKIDTVIYNMKQQRSRFGNSVRP